MLSLGVYGKLIMNALVMYDREADSLWSQFLGKAVSGPLKGTALEIVPSQLTNYANWTKLHPDTLALDTGQNSPTNDHYVQYYFSSNAGILGGLSPAGRLQRKELVLGIVGQDGGGGVQLRYVARRARNKDEFEGTPLVVAVDPDAGGTGIYRRDVNGQVLSFENFDNVSMTDRETKSQWDKATGRPMIGESLTSYPYILSFWFAWTDFYHEARLYELPQAGR